MASSLPIHCISKIFQLLINARVWKRAIEWWLSLWFYCESICRTSLLDVTIKIIYTGLIYWKQLVDIFNFASHYWLFVMNSLVIFTSFFQHNSQRPSLLCYYSIIVTKFSTYPTLFLFFTLRLHSSFIYARNNYINNFRTIRHFCVGPFWKKKFCFLFNIDKNITGIQWFRWWEDSQDCITRFHYVLVYIFIICFFLLYFSLFSLDF